MKNKRNKFGILMNKKASRISHIFITPQVPGPGRARYCDREEEMMINCGTAGERPYTPRAAHRRADEKVFRGLRFPALLQRAPLRRRETLGPRARGDGGRSNEGGQVLPL
jgi:hypothetical protein